MAKMKGFSFFEKRKVRSAAHEAESCLSKALAEAFGNNDGFQRRVEKYFGTSVGGREATMHSVMKTINSMKVVVSSDIYKVARGGDQDGTNAEAENLPQMVHQFKGDLKKKARTARYQGTRLYAGKIMNVVEATMDYAGKYAQLEITLFDEYFKLPYKIGNAQSQVETFLHELSHTAAGTLDVDAPRCYGFEGVLYCKQAGKANLNAENYGMFLQSYLI